MYTTSLRKVGGSIMMAVPPAILDMLQMRAGTMVSVDVDHGRLVVEPQLRPRYTLDELLAQCDASVPISTKDHAWLDSGPVGSELL
ncbi:MAG: AbrB/MazE/SpoVT family DNA-binding domain-containing protein [Gammaproteobacteria bacterium]